MLPFEIDVSSKYGAPMGRRSDLTLALTGKVHVRRVPLVDGGCYDKGGAYWGGGTPLFCAWDDEGRAHYLRAASREAAKRTLHTGNPNITFYR